MKKTTNDDRTDTNASELTQSPNSTYTNRILELRKRMDLTQEEFIERMANPISVTMLSGLERQKKPLTLKLALEIADTFDVSLDWLYGRCEDMADIPTRIIDTLQKIFTFKRNDEYDNLSISVDNNLLDFLLKLTEAETLKREKDLPLIAYQAWVDKIKYDYNTKIKEENATLTEYLLINPKQIDDYKKQIVLMEQRGAMTPPVGLPKSVE